MHHLFVEHLFQYVFGRQQPFHHGNEQEDGNEVAVGPHAWLEVRLLLGPHTVEAAAKGDEGRACEGADGRRMPPVEPVAIIEDVGDLKSKQAPEGCPQPVNAFQGHTLRHGTPRARQEKLNGNNEHHQSNDQPIGRVPVERMPEEGTVPRLHFNACQ